MALKPQYRTGIIIVLIFRTVFSSIDGVSRPQCIIHIKRTRRTQFYAPMDVLGA